MKTFLTTTILFLLTTLFSAQGEADSRPVKLGAVLPLTGDLAYYGNEIRNGLLLAKEHSKHPVEIRIEDAPLLGGQILTAFEKLVTVDEIDAIAGNFSNQGMLMMSRGIDRHKVPTFHTAAADDQILAASEWIVTTNVRTADEAATAAEHVFKKIGAHRAAILAVETSFGHGYRKAFISEFESLGGHVVADEIQPTTSLDVRTQVMRLLAKDPEVLFLATFGPYLGSAVKEVRRLGSSIPLITVYEVEDPSVVSSAGEKALNGIRYFVSYRNDGDFEKSYRARFGTIPQTFARNAYDAATLLISATKECNFERSCVKARLYRVKQYQGASGTFDIESDGGARKELFLHEYRDGEFRVVVD